MGMNLFGGSDSEKDNECPKIEVDKEFARRYEHNKKREDLQRYEELKKSGQIPRGEDSDGSSSSSSDDDEDGDLFSANSRKDLKFFDALIKVRRKDPSLKNKDVKLFDSDDESDRENDQKKKKKKNKAMYLKDVVAKQLIEDGPDFDQDEEGDLDNDNNNKLVYDEEQEKIRNAFLEVVEGDGGEEVNGQVLTMKSKSKEEEAESDGDEELKKKVDEYFGSGGDEDQNTKFLKDYFVNKMWIDKRAPHGDGNGDDDDEEIRRISEDEEEVEKQEEYEFRYQEGAGDQVLGHSRQVVGTVRKRESSRKEQRRHKEEREEAARLEREEELRRLKNVKRKEMESRVRRIMEIAGIEEGDRSAPLSAKELEDEFDPEEYDRMMEKAFGDDYYAADVANNDDDDDDDDDENDGDDFDKPNFDAEDEELGLPKGWDGREDGSLEKEEEEEEEEEEEGKKEKKKKKLAIFEKAKEAMMDEYYKLDYEDTIGDLKTRFKYANTKGKRYGLSAAAILLMEDKELNQYVPMNKIAPYKDKEWKVPEGKRYEMKLKVNELLLGRGKMDERKSKKRGFRSDKASTSSSSAVAVEEEDPNEESGGLSKAAKRRKKQADLKLSNSRLMAYGKISSSKHTKKKKTSH